MSADSTGLNRITQTYRCRFGGKQRGISSKTDYPCYVKYICEPDGSYSIKDSCWFHNHEIDRITFSSHFNTCISDEINEERNQQMIGVLPCQIRSNLDICMNSKSYYYHQQPAIKQMKTENFDEFKTKCEYPDFIRRISSSNGRFICATYVHLPVANSYYCDDVITIDDTSTTNIYNLPIEVMIVVDQEKKSQLLAFSFLSDLTSDSYAAFFTIVKEITKKEPRIMIADRKYDILIQMTKLLSDLMILNITLVDVMNILIY